MITTRVPAKLVTAMLATATLLTPSAHGIITRHDADCTATRAEARQFAAVGKVLPDGEAVLIAPQWVLTAAHVATGAPRKRLRVRFAAIEYRIAEVIAFPNWQPGKNDLALMRLTQPVRFVEPLALHNGDLDEHSVVLLAGRGDYGDGLKGIVGNDGQLRIARNVIWQLESNRMSLMFDKPGSEALATEGISGPGDSGTPALVEQDGRLEVVGISSVGRLPDKGRYGEYGSVDIFIRTAAYREWIKEVLDR